MKDLLLKRYSERKYNTERIVSSDLNYILECMLLSPSGKNKNPWEFIMVNDVHLVNKLANAKNKGGNFLAYTQHSIVVVGDSNASDTWIEDASVTMTLGHLAASHLGLGSCWVQIRNRTNDDGPSENYLKTLLNIPKDLSVLAILSLGHVSEMKVVNKKIDFSKVSTNLYGEKYDG